MGDDADQQLLVVECLGGLEWVRHGDVLIVAVNMLAADLGLDACRRCIQEPDGPEQSLP